MPAEAAASAVMIAGLGALHLAWLRPGERAGLRRYLVGAGWAMLVLGTAGWALGGRADVGLPIGVVLAMSLALALVAGRSLLLKSGHAARKQGRFRADPDGLDLGSGCRGRAAVRLAGSLVLAPLAGLVAGLLWRAYGPGEEADRLIGLAFVLVGVTAGAWVLQLASARPWRTAAIILGAAAVGAAALLPAWLAAR